MRKIRLLTISATCERGGSDINLLRLLRSLDKNEYDIVHLVPYAGHLTDEFRNAGVQIKIVDMPRIRLFKNPLKYITYIFKFFPTVFKIKNIIACNQIDLVCTSSMVNLYGALAARLARRPHILMVAEYLPVLKLISPYFHFLSERIICCSSVVSRMFKKNGKVLVKYPGVDLDEFSPNVDSRAIKEEFGISGNLVSMLTRLDKWKGVETFIKAAKYVEHEAKFIIFGELVIGKEKYLGKLENIIKQLKLEEKVFIKIVKCTPQLISASDIIVHASLRPEPFGLIVIEGMAAGKPVIASRLGGPLEIITDGIDGVLIEPGNPQVLAAAISNLLRNPKAAGEMGLKAREGAGKKFNLKEYAHGFDRIFKEALKDYSLKPARICIGKSRLVKISAPLAELLVPVHSKYQEINKDTIKKILVIQLFGMGDLVCSLPLLETLKAYFNQSKITLLIDSKLSELANLMGCNEIIGCERGILSEFTLLYQIRRDKFDMVVILNPLFQGAWLAYLSRAKYRIGHIRDYEGIQDIGQIRCLLTHVTPTIDYPVHDLRRHMGIAGSMGIDLQFSSPHLNIPDSAANWADSFLKDNGVKEKDFIFGINPNAAWESRCWPTDNFAKAADSVIENYNATAIFFGSTTRRDMERISIIMSKMKHRAISAGGKTDIPKLAALLKRCAIFLTNDSGPMHLAAAEGVDMVALFGPGDIKKFGYERVNIINITAEGPFCKPCALNYQYKDNCLDNACMKGIDVSEVIKAIDRLLSSKNN